MPLFEITTQETQGRVYEIKASDADEARAMLDRGEWGDVRDLADAQIEEILGVEEVR